MLYQKRVLCTIKGYNFENSKVKYLMNIEQEIKDLAKKYANDLKSQIDNRTEEMKSDDKSHYLVYQVLGVTDEESFN